MVAAILAALQSVFSPRRRAVQLHACNDQLCPRCKSPSIAPAKADLTGCVDCNHVWRA
jgi:hypothetical protein